MEKWEIKVKKQDKKYSKKYKPITHGLPRGMSKTQWWKKKHEDSKHNESSFFIINYL